MADQIEITRRRFDYFRLVLGMTRRLIDQFPDAELDRRPAKGARSAKEIVAHMYAFLVEAADSVRKSAHHKEPEPSPATKAELLAYVDRQVDRFYRILAEIDEAMLQREIAAYGTTFPGWQFLDFAYDEHWHHRGQLTVYLRLCGIQPVMIYDYGMSLD